MCTMCSVNSLLAQEWENISPILPGADTVYNHYLTGDFITGSTGWLVALGQSRVYFTSDGGRSWEVAFEDDSTRFSDIWFTSAHYGWGKAFYYPPSEPNDLRPPMKTTDGGHSWEVTTFPPDSNFYSGYFLDSLRGFIGNENAIYRTIDGGLTWQAATIQTDARFGITDFTFVGDSLGWAVGERRGITETGIIFHTSDGGATWTTQLPETLILEGVDFYTPQFGVAVGSNVWWESVVLMTWDGGQHWEDQYYSEGSFLWDVALTSASTGWAVGWGGTILYTTDGGHSWSRASSPTTEDLNKVVFVANDSDRVGYIFGDNGTLLRYESPITAIQSAPARVPAKVQLGAPYPNPFNAQIAIPYSLPKSQRVTLTIFDLTGKKITTLYAGIQTPGEHVLRWDGTDHAGSQIGSGVYFLQLTTQEHHRTRKVMLLQ